MNKWVVVLIVLFLFPKVTLAGDNRMDKRFGIYLTVLGDPFLSEGGINVAYNSTDYLRLTGGLGYSKGSGGSAKTLGVGAKALLPGAEFTPIFGFNLSEIFIDFDEPFFPYFGSETQNILFYYSNLGFDYQARDGFNFGLGINFFPLNGFGGFPYLDVGIFL